MERESHENSAGRHGRDTARADEETAAGADLDQETIPVEDVGTAPGEGAAVDDV